MMDPVALLMCCRRPDRPAAALNVQLRAELRPVAARNDHLSMLLLLRLLLPAAQARQVWMRLGVARLRLEERSLRVMVTVMIVPVILLILGQLLLRWIWLRLLRLLTRDVLTDPGLMLKRRQLTVRSLNLLVLLLPLRMMMAVMMIMAIDLGVIRLIGDIPRRAI